MDAEGPMVQGPMEMELLRVYIARLRNKLEDNPKAPKYIVTKPRIGYCLQGLQPSDQL